MGRYIGALLLIIGTCIGASILALPLVTAGLNIFLVLGILLSVWCVMTLSAMLIVDLNLNLHGNANLVSMAKVTLGRYGIMVTWVIYLLLLYTLLCAYLEGGSDLVGGLLQLISINVPSSVATILFLIIFALILYQGIRCVDLANRGLMTFKLLAFLLLIILLVPHSHHNNLIFTRGTPGSINSIMPIVNSFGFAIIVPTISAYLNKNHFSVRLVVILGSLLPLTAYIAWIIAVQMSIPASMLLPVAESKDSITGLAQIISQASTSSSVSFLSHFFTTICVTTSFLAVSISLIDFLIDGFRLNHATPKKPIFIMVIALLPPLIIVLLKPGIFILFLKYAGALCVLLLILLPTLMSWSACYVKKIVEKPAWYSSRSALILNFFVGVFLLIFAAKAIF